jgi:glycosyltransferase involved in cell wall biosynthesis
MSKSIRVVEVVHNWPAEVFIQRHIHAMQEQGISPIIVARHADVSYAQSSSVHQSESSGLIIPNFDRLSNINKLISLKYLIGNLTNFYNKHRPIRDRVLLTYFEKLRPSLIHFHNASLAALMAWIPQEMGIPYTLSLRGSDIQVYPLHEEIEKKGIIQALSGAAGVHSVCNELGRQAQILAPRMSQPTTIYTSVPISGDLPVHLPSWDGKLRLLSIGRLCWQKSYVNLLIAFKVFLDQGFAANLSIIGDGPDQESLIYWINYLGLKSHVSLLGKLDYANIIENMMNSDAYIQSSIAEGLSNSTAEAMALGMTVFATDVGGTSEIIQDNINGYLLNPTRPQDWWEKLSLISDSDLMNKLRKNSWQTAKEYFSAEKHAAKFIEFYTRVLNG